MTKKSIQTFAAGMILATGVLAIVFFLTGKDEAAADTTTKETLAQKVTDTDVKNYLDSKKKSLSAVKRTSSFLTIRKKR